MDMEKNIRMSISEYSKASGIIAKHILHPAAIEIHITINS
jgi:hypothetical protein